MNAPRIPLALSLLILFPALVLNPQMTAAQETGEVTPVGPALSGEIVSLYVPPTRTKEPYAATQKAVYRLEKDSNAWEEIYSVASQGSTILEIQGYAESSKVLYLVHSNGGARTKNSGGKWDRFTPPAFSQSSRDYVGIAVDPNERKEAVLLAKHKAWITRDYGLSWSGLELPSAEEAVEIAYSEAGQSQLVLATSQAVYRSTNRGRSWQALMRNLEGPRLMDLSPVQPWALVLERSQVMRMIDLDRLGYQVVRPASPELEQVDQMSIDCAARGAVWVAAGGKLFIRSLHGSEDSISLLHESTKPLKNVQRHPRDADGVFWTEGNQVFRMSAAHGSLASELQQQFPPEAFERDQETLVAAEQSKPGSPQGEEAWTLLNSLLASQPPLEEAIALALREAQIRPNETARWKANVRRRNLLPRLRLVGELRETTRDRSDRVVNVDRFGTPEQDSLREDDSIETLDSYRVELTWELSKLLFDPEEIDISQETRSISRQKNRTVTEVSELYYDRLELILDEKLHAEEMNVEELVTLRLRIKQKTGLLNQLCGQAIFTQ